MKRRISLFLAILLVIGLVLPAVSIDAHAESGFENFAATNEYYDGRFSDVHANDWFAPGVQSAYEIGLMNGNSDTTFNPAGEITIIETIVLACRLHSTYKGESVDFSGGSPWYQPYIDYAVANSIIMDYSYNDYSAKASRAVFANIIYSSLPADTWTRINTIDKLPDVKWDDWFATPVLALYNAGILTGSDQYGTFRPSSNITRSEVATIVTRVAIPQTRRQFTLVEKLVSEGAPAQTPATPSRSAVTIHGVTSDTIVFVSNRSNTIHKVHDCSGMKNYREMTIEEAEAHGYKYCPNCW